VTLNTKQCARHEPLYDIDPQTGASIEVFYADRALETFGRRGAGWFWWSRRRGFSPEGSPICPFATSYAAYRHAMNAAAANSQRGRLGYDTAKKAESFASISLPRSSVVEASAEGRGENAIIPNG